jgi:DNA-binding NtrC family response regulator
MRSGPGSVAELAARSLQATGTPWLDLGGVSDPLELSRLQALHGGVLYVPDLGRLSRAQQKNLAFALDRLDRHELRMVMASEQGPEDLVAAGWEESLVLRLFEVSIALPSLAELRDEVPELAAQILGHQVEAGEVPLRHFSTGALNALRNHPWPGGIGELRAAVKSLALAALEDEISVEAVHELLAKVPAVTQGLLLDQPLREAREAFERLYFEHHLRLEGGNMTRLAEKTGLERTHLYRKLKQLGLPAGRRHEDA